MDLRPQLERLDRLVLRSEGLDPEGLSFAFRPLWQLDAPGQASVALAKAQASAVYAGLGLWPAAVTARLVEAQVAADGVYPNAEAVFAEGRAAAPAPAPVPEPAPTLDFDPAQPRAPDGRWTAGGGGAAASSPPAVEASAGAGPHAPDGSAITPAASRRGRGKARALGAIACGLERLIRRNLPEAEETAEPGATPPKPDPEPSPDQPPLKPDPRAAQKLDNVLSDYDTRRYDIGDQQFQLDKGGMRHILERHAPEYWDGSVTKTQTFFPRGTTIAEIKDVIGDVLGQNRDAILAEPSKYEWHLTGISGGTRYSLSTYQGRITTLYPQP